MEWIDLTIKIGAVATSFMSAYILLNNPRLPFLIIRDKFSKKSIYELRSEIQTVHQLSDFDRNSRYIPSKKQIFVYRFKIPDNVDDPRLVQIAEKFNAEAYLSELHEVHHARISKYTSSFFLGSGRPNLKTRIEDEIAARINQIIGFVSLTTAQRRNIVNYSFTVGAIKESFVLAAHRAIAALPQYKDMGVSDIASDEYVKFFNNIATKNPHVYDIIAKVAADDLDEQMPQYRKYMKAAAVLVAKMMMPDFYKKPISRKTARNKIFTFNHGTECLNILENMSEQGRDALEAHIDKMVKSI